MARVVKGKPMSVDLQGLSETEAARRLAEIGPLKTKGRVIVDFKTPAESAAALAAVLALS
ncbi:hypothetical protein ABID41_003682 [Phenylobacterium koreense]|uniref:Uncharacterized protein n=1 Tax=Phenylobacterium koreense TaxID=266125 RepID=A0ABV2ENA0_9CAUL